MCRLRRGLSAFGGGFDWSLQHAEAVIGSGSVADEAPEEDLPDR